MCTTAAALIHRSNIVFFTQTLCSGGANIQSTRGARGFCFPCVTKQQMLVKVFCVLQESRYWSRFCVCYLECDVSLGISCITCNPRKIYIETD